MPREDQKAYNRQTNSAKGIKIPSLCPLFRISSYKYHFHIHLRKIIMRKNSPREAKSEYCPLRRNKSTATC